MLHFWEEYIDRKDSFRRGRRVPFLRYRGCAKERQRRAGRGEKGRKRKQTNVEKMKMTEKTQRKTKTSKITQK